MQEADEQETCRICRAPAGLDQPFFHPCKCSGTIRYIHQDCLTTWLAHTKKKGCDICKHPFRFTKFYAPDMPSKLPTTIIVRGLTRYLFHAFVFVLRGICVAAIWLGLLPWVTLWTWRMYFLIGETLAWSMSRYPKPPAEGGDPVYGETHYNPIPHAPRNLVERIFSHPMWTPSLSNIFTGQIIISLVILTSVVVALLWEYISQHAPLVFLQEQDPLPVDPLRGPQLGPQHPAHHPFRPAVPVRQPLPQIQDHANHQRMARWPARYREPMMIAIQRRAEATRTVHAMQQPATESELDLRRRSFPRRSVAEAMRAVNAMQQPATESRLDLLMRSSLPRRRAEVVRAVNAAQQPATEMLLDPRMRSSPPRRRVLTPANRRLSSGPLDIPLEQTAFGFLFDGAPPLRSSCSPSDADVHGSSSSSNTKTPSSTPLIKLQPRPQQPGLVDEVIVLDQECEDGRRTALGVGKEQRQGFLGVAGVRGVELPQLEGDRSDRLASDSNTDEESGDENANSHAQRPDEPGAEDEKGGLRWGDDEDEALAGDAEGNVGGVTEVLVEAMEVIGMCGPFSRVLQKAAFIIFGLNILIGLGVWIPFTVGKTAILLSLDPLQFLQFLQLPIHVMRLLTDPSIDFVVYIIMESPPSRISSFISSSSGLSTFSISNLYGGKFLRSGGAGCVSNFLFQVYQHLADLLTSFQVPLTYVEDVMGSASSALNLIAYIQHHLGSAEPYFAWLGRDICLLLSSMQLTWTQLSLRSGPRECVFATLLGYPIISVFFCLCLNILTTGKATTPSFATRNVVCQLLFMLKVATLICIEFVALPLGCGIILDIFVIGLFPEANMQSRAASFSPALLTTLFYLYCWAAGATLIHSFTVLVLGCQSVVRPGAMWFIRDPQSQNSQLVHDILNRPISTQLQNICINIALFSILAACIKGSVAGLLVLCSKSIMPFQWNNRKPLSNVPIDLLFFVFIVPYTACYFHPEIFLRDTARVVWKFFAKYLRLTSYFFGGRYASEELASTMQQDKLLQPDVATIILDGSFHRVPATNNLALPCGMQATVEVTAMGFPVDDAAQAIMAAQDAQMKTAQQDIQKDFIVVYIPPHFCWRIVGLVALLWVSGVILLGFSMVLPIQLGRMFFNILIACEVHDGYSFIIGFYLLWMCFILVQALHCLGECQQEGNRGSLQGTLYLWVMKQGSLWLVKYSYMAMFLGVVIPVLLTIMVNLYIVLPIRFALDPSVVPRISVVDSWALGLIYMKIIMNYLHVLPPNKISKGLQQVMVNGWTHPDPIRAMNEVILPLASGLLGMNLIPGLVYYFFHHLFPHIVPGNGFVLEWVYPGFFFFISTIKFVSVLFGPTSSWSQAIRDKEFLMEMRLRNHDPEWTVGGGRKGRVG